ncbi:hypothetical protein GALL_199390 [mine drainage metagenome]|uniref:Phage holin family protein n=1 Tax=mine drainage metagenome TaxID=410659 RepID=A0A1J5RQW9_9ZZZZ
MKTDASGPPGLVESLRSLGDGLIAAVQDRVELFSIEFQEEKLRFIRVLVWIAAAIFSGVMVMLFASMTLVYLFWESARITVLVGLTAFYLAALFVTVVVLRRSFVGQPGPFAGTRRELGDDRTCIRGRN